MTLKAIQGDIDASTTQGKLYFHIYSLMLEYERNWLRDRVIDGLEAARARGRKGGRKPTLNEKQTKMLIDMYNSQKYIVKDIAEHFGLKPNTIWSIVRKHREKQLAKEGAI